MIRLFSIYLNTTYMLKLIAHPSQVATDTQEVNGAEDVGTFRCSVAVVGVYN